MNDRLTILDLGPEQVSEKNATDLVTLLSKKLDGLTVPSDNRSRLAGSCLSVALDHHAGLVLLISTGLYAPGFALLRPTYEAFVRGTWLRWCACESQVDDFMCNRPIPKIGHLLARIEQSSPFGAGVLDQAHKRNWGALCGLAHNGVEQTRYTLSETEIARYCSREVIDEALSYAGAIAFLSAIAVCAMADEDEIAVALLDEAKRLVLKSPP